MKVCSSLAAILIVLSVASPVLGTTTVKTVKTAAATATGMASCPAAQPLSNMTLTFDDEFTNTTLDPTKWTAVAAGGADAINGELEAYIPSGVQILPAGGLRLQANRQPFWKEQYTSGEIISYSHFSQSYGHFEMSAKMPDGNGLWPAFWLLPDNNAWPPEIDILEYIYAPFGVMPTSPDTTSNSVQTIHWASSSGNQMQSFSKYGDMGQAYHTYAIDWRPGSLVFLIDGIVQNCITDSATTGTRVPSQPMYILANLAIGAAGSWSGTVNNSTPFPANMDIRYIRAYQFNDVTPPPPEPITIRNISVSNPTAAAGQKITISADLAIGNKMLNGPTFIQFILYNYDGSKYVTALTYNGPSFFTANTTYHISMPYIIPSSMTPGIYTVAVAPFWSNWASLLWSSERLSPPITITSR